VFLFVLQNHIIENPMKVLLPVFFQLCSVMQPDYCIFILQVVLANTVKIIYFLQGFLERDAMVNTTSGIHINCLHWRRMMNLILNMECTYFFFLWTILFDDVFETDSTYFCLQQSYVTIIARILVRTPISISIVNPE
jgi:hypothetical protein